MQIRDEFSKIVDVRIPPNGYRKYVKEISRMGAFGQLQMENTLIALLEAVDELQQQVQELRSVNAPHFTTTFAATKPMLEVGELACSTCGRICASEFGLQSHSRTHKKNETVTPTK